MSAEMIQGSEEWLKVRVGKVTASRVSDVIAKTKTGWGASRANYMAELVAERLTGVPAAQYQNAAMKWGIETEPQARAAYEFFRDVTVQTVGFIDGPLPMTGSSPDGLVGEDGLVEFKCPNTATHIETILSGGIDKAYATQMMWQMASTGRSWCDYVSFDPRMPAEMQLVIIRRMRDDTEIAQLKGDVSAFLGELDSKIKKLKSLYEAKAA